MKHYSYENLLPVNSDGFYGAFGGAFVPERLKRNLLFLEQTFREQIADVGFQEEFERLLHDYAGRPTPLYRSAYLSRRYGAEVYLKREDLCHTGAHKVNNAIGLGLLAKRMGCSHLIAETGAGQHGVATATVAALLDMKCTVYMGAEDIRRQQPNVMRMKMLGAKVVAVESGNATLNNAVDAALNAWCENPDKAFYLIGSAVGPHPYPEMVARFQSVISEEIKNQLLSQTGRAEPDYIVAAIGGGSNAAGAFYHFIKNPSVRLIAVEAGGHGVLSGETAASLSVGKTCVIHGFRTKVITDSKGDVAEAYSISAGLDYPGIGPLHAFLHSEGRLKVVVVDDDEAVSAAKRLARHDGIIPALESAHAVAALENLDLKSGETVVVNLSGRGDKDMSAYISHY